MRFWTGFLLAFTTASWAAASWARDEPGFYTEQTLPASAVPENLSRALRASYQLLLPQGRCSAIGLSPSGYVLTALHCAVGCFKSSETQVHRKNGRQWFRTFSPGLSSRTCLVALADASDEPRAFTAELVAYGKGYVTFAERDLPRLSPAQVDFAKANLDDYAILKFSVKKPLSCLPLADRSPTRGEKIWAIGYPDATTRSNDIPGSSGDRQVISYGTVSDEVRENEYYRHLKFDEAAYDRARAIYVESGQILSDMDIFSGSSGSMAIDAQGRLVGVNVAIAGSSDDSRNRYYQNIAVSLRIEKILEGLKQKPNGFPTKTDLAQCENLR